MKKKIIWLIVSSLMVLSLVLASCGTKTAPTTTPITTLTTTIVTTTTTTSPTTKVIPTPTGEVPKYGGTFTYRNRVDVTHFDPFFSAGIGAKLWYEELGMRDLTVDRKIWEFKLGYYPYVTGRLIESWEMAPDFKSFTLHVRKGVRWHDIPPVNGRELTAYDIEWNFHRILGLGSGFSKPTPWRGDIDNFRQIKSVTAIDKYTVVCGLAEPSIEEYLYIFQRMSIFMVARESVEKWGTVEDWQNTIGTGPFILKDYVRGTSITALKNPYYWGYDRLNLKNQLPYVDIAKILIIPDDATAYAALRTGKIDVVDSVSWVQAASLKQTNPELIQGSLPQNGWCILLHVDTKPFDDFKVRRAMQMALDVPTIAKTYFGGTMEAEPKGVFAVPGYCTPFAQWPQEVKDGYTYNPTGAKKLLAETGYPSGFKFTLTASVAHDIDLYQIIKSYFKDIGIEMEIQVMDNSAFTAYTQADKHVAMSSQLGSNVTYPPFVLGDQFRSGHFVYRGHIVDSAYDVMWDKSRASTTEEAYRSLVIKMGDYANAKQWRVILPPLKNFTIWQPWLKGYQGELDILDELSALVWVDQTMKEEK